jgi:hypothetical protein
MSGVGIPSSNAVPGAEQNSLYNNDSRNNFQGNQLGKHGVYMQENTSQSSSPRTPQNPHGIDNQSPKAAGNAGHFVSGEYVEIVEIFRHHSNISYDMSKILSSEIYFSIFYKQPKRDFVMYISYVFSFSCL